MKKVEKTNIPRKEELNKALVELGKKTHSDKRKKKIEQERRYKEQQGEDYEDEEWEE